MGFGFEFCVLYYIGVMFDFVFLLFFDVLGMLLVWVGVDGCIIGCNLVFGCWLGVSGCCLLGQLLVVLEVQGEVLVYFLVCDECDSLCLNWLVLVVFGEVLCFVEGWMSCCDDGGWLLEVYLVDEFFGFDLIQVLFSVFSVVLKGLVYELCNLLVGLKGVVQLLVCWVVQCDVSECELIELIGLEIECFNGLFDQLLLLVLVVFYVELNIYVVFECVLCLVENEVGWVVCLQCDYDFSIFEFYGDVDCFIQVVWNLVCNVIQVGVGSIILCICVEYGVCIVEYLYMLVLCLEIVDDGCGVFEELVEYLFLLLVSGCVEGIGFGLVLVQQVVCEYCGMLIYCLCLGYIVFILLLLIGNGVVLVEEVLCDV